MSKSWWGPTASYSPASSKEAKSILARIRGEETPELDSRMKSKRHPERRYAATARCCETVTLMP